MVYVDYSYYANEYLGTLPEDSFNPLAIKASREIDNNVNTGLTEEIINDLPEKAQDQLKYTACALIDLIYKKQKSDSKNISSFSIDGVNKTFKTISDEDYKKSKKDIIESLPDELTCYL